MLIELKNKIIEKNKLEKKIENLEKEIALIQRECSVMKQQLEEDNFNLDNCKRRIFVINKEYKLLELEEKVRKSKSKLKANHYQLNLYQVELERLNSQYDEVKDSESKYQEVLNDKIQKLNHVEYITLQKENNLYQNIIYEAEQLMDCLKKIDLYTTRGDNYAPTDKLYTLGNSTWIIGSPTADIHNFKKEIVVFEALLKEIDNELLKEDIELYFKYSKDFFENVLSLVSFVRTDMYTMKVIDFKRDISNITNKIRIIYQDNLTKELEIRRQLEEYLLK